MPFRYRPTFRDAKAEIHLIRGVLRDDTDHGRYHREIVLRKSLQRIAEVCADYPLILAACDLVRQSVIAAGDLPSSAPAMARVREMVNLLETAMDSAVTKEWSDSTQVSPTPTSDNTSSAVELAPLERAYREALAIDSLMSQYKGIDRRLSEWDATKDVPMGIQSIRSLCWDNPAVLALCDQFDTAFKRDAEMPRDTIRRYHLDKASYALKALLKKQRTEMWNRLRAERWRPDDE